MPQCCPREPAAGNVNAGSQKGWLRLQAFDNRGGETECGEVIAREAAAAL